jgi:hypothetical protein
MLNRLMMMSMQPPQQQPPQEGQVPMGQAGGMPPSGGGFQVGNIPGRAWGGPVEAGHPYWVGEQGPELLAQGPMPPQVVGSQGPQVIVPNQDGQVIPNNAFEQALQQYPILQKVGVKGVYTNTPGKYGDIESWQPGEPGTTGYERPKDIPLDAFGVQVFGGGKTKPIDVLADVASHYMVNTDPTMKQYYQEFKDSLTPRQKEKLQRDYQYDKERGEKRPFDQWAEASRLPSFFRGYTFNQWPEEFTSKLFNKDQIQLFNKVRDYLGVKEESKQ